MTFIRALSDVAMQPLEQAQSLPFRAYTRQGELEAIPYNMLIAVDRAAHQLTNYSIDNWNGLVFVNLDQNAKPLGERLAGIDQYLSLFQPDTFDQISQGEVEVWQTNWKLAMENAMESYHLFKVHEITLETYSPTRDAYYIAGSSEWTLTGGATQRKKQLLETLFGNSRNELLEHYVLVSLPPSFVGILSYGSFGWLSAHPIDEQTTRIRSGATFSSTSMGDGMEGGAQEADFTRAFFLEDKEMCERVQSGMRSRLARGGKLVDMEWVVVDFHQFLGTRFAGLPKTEVYEDEAATRWKNADE